MRFESFAFWFNLYFDFQFSLVTPLDDERFFLEPFSDKTRLFMVFIISIYKI